MVPRAYRRLNKPLVPYSGTFIIAQYWQVRKGSFRATLSKSAPECPAADGAVQLWSSIMSHFFGILFFFLSVFHWGKGCHGGDCTCTCTYTLPPLCTCQKSLFIELRNDLAEWSWVSNKNATLMIVITYIVWHQSIEMNTCTCTCTKYMYRSLAKEGPLWNIRPFPSLASISF